MLSPPAAFTILFGTAVAVAVLLVSSGWTMLVGAGLIGVLLAAIDLRSLRLPDPLVALLAFAVVLPLTVASAPDVGRAVLAAGVLGLAHLVLALLPGGHLGLGDVKLAAVLGFALGHTGWPTVLIGVILPHLIFGPVALFLLLTGRARGDSALPFGPALLVGALAALLLAQPP